MNVLVMSVSHATAPLDVVAGLAMDADTSAKLASVLVDGECVEEALVLSTCNRTEVWAAVNRFHGGLEDVAQQLADLSGQSLAKLQSLCAVYYDEAAVQHCFRVSAGLESLVTGEQQILGQVRASLIGAQNAGTVGPTLNALAQQALRVGKRVHTETAVGAAGRSLLGAALERLDAVGALGGAGAAGGDLAAVRTLVVGAGSMAALAARTCAARGSALTVVNRSLDKADHLARSIGGRARPLVELDAALGEADLVITCTGARSLHLGVDDLLATPVRAVIDLALPADVDPAVADFPGVELVSLETLRAGGFDGASAEEVAAARALVDGEVADFVSLRRAASVTPTVVALRSMATDVVDRELQRLLGRLPELTEREQAEVASALRRSVEKVLHQPTVRVRKLAAESDGTDYAAALRHLFDLDSSVRAVSQPR